MKNTVFLVLLSCILIGCGEVRQKEADLILHNATVYTVNTSFTKAEAIAVKDGKIIDLGAEREILNRYQSKNKIDCRKAFIYPGFHTEVYSKYQKELNQDFIRRLSAQGATSVAIYGGKEVPALLRGDSSALTKNITYYPQSVQEFEELHSDAQRFYNLNGVFSTQRQERYLTETSAKGIPLHWHVNQADDALDVLAEFVDGTNDERRALHIMPNDNLKRTEVLREKTVIPMVHYLHGQLTELLDQNKILVLTGGMPVERFQGAVASGLRKRDALRALTIWSALVHFNEANSGSIEKGKRADFTVLNADLLSDVKTEVKVLYTIINGETLYKHD